MPLFGFWRLFGSGRSGPPVVLPPYATEGTVVIAPLVPPDTSNTYPTHHADYGHGGHRSVATSSDLAGVSLDRRRSGMLATAVDTKTVHRLKHPAENGTWVPQWVSQGAGTSSPIVTSVVAGSGTAFHLLRPLGGDLIPQVVTIRLPLAWSDVEATAYLGTTGDPSLYTPFGVPLGEPGSYSIAMGITSDSSLTLTIVGGQQSSDALFIRTYLSVRS